MNEKIYYKDEHVTITSLWISCGHIMVSLGEIDKICVSMKTETMIVAVTFFLLSLILLPAGCCFFGFWGWREGTASYKRIRPSNVRHFTILKKGVLRFVFSECMSTRNSRNYTLSLYNQAQNMLQDKNFQRTPGLWQNYFFKFNEINIICFLCLQVAGASCIKNETISVE